MATSPRAAEIDLRKNQIRVLDRVRWRWRKVGIPRLAYQRRVVSLDDKPEYIAVSYVWGDQAQRQPILLDGIETSVTQSLYDVLMWTASRRLHLPVWADAVCINQADSLEKNHQVGQMDRVYRQAHRVVCWLGPKSTPDIDAYFKYALSGERSSEWTQLLYEIARPSVRQALRFHQQRRGWLEFTGLPYFCRMWTLQEMLLPDPENTVFVHGGVVRTFNPRDKPKVDYPWCYDSAVDKVDAKARLVASGDGSAKLSKSEQRFVEERQDMLVNSVEAVYDARKASALLFSGDDCGYRLSSLLFASHWRQCENHRDKLFALLGLLQGPPRTTHITDQQEPILVARARSEYLEIDYDKPVERVVRDAVCYIYQYEDEDKFVTDIGHYYRLYGSRHSSQPSPRVSDEQSSASHDWPSWLPDLTRPRVEELPGRRNRRFDGLTWDVTIRLGSVFVRDMLRFDAWYIGKVVQMEPFPDSAQALAEHVSVILNEARAEEDSVLGGDTGPLSTACGIRGLVRNCQPAQGLAHRFDKALRAAAGFERFSAWSGETSLWEGWEASGTERRKDDYMKAAADRLRGQALALLDNGQFITGPNTIQPGDQVFFSSAWPSHIALREQTNAEITLHQMIDLVLLDDLHKDTRLMKEPPIQINLV